MTYKEVCEQAMRLSIEFQCTQHVCAVLKRTAEGGVISHYKVSDWYDESVVTSFSEGIEHA